MTLRQVIEKSHLYVGSRCGDRDTDVTVLIQTLKDAGFLHISETKGLKDGVEND
jgi:hypothetical protein